MVDSPKSVLVQLKEEYELCRYCLARQAGSADTKTKKTKTETKKTKRVEKCHICRGLFNKLDEIAKKALAAAEQYQFETFLVGATLPMQLFEREDALRARFKIRGKENVKSQLTRELGKRLAKTTGKRVDFARPDVTLNVAIDKEGNIDAVARARPIALEGRYTKKIRGLPQKQERCPMCEGSGCNLCDNTGLYGNSSVEDILTKHVVRATGGRSPRFSWVGSEDQKSLVLGRGRPFYVKISDPRTRSLHPDPKKRRFSEAGVTATITGALDDVPDTQGRFTVKTRIACVCSRPIAREDIARLKSLAGMEAKFANRSKMAAKKIYSAQVKKTGESEFILTIEADGGLPIKQFVGGQEYMEPNVAALLGAKCECVTFDILEVKQGSPMSLP